jgi:hypothetical protein
MQLILSKVFFCGTEGAEGTEVPGAEARLPGSLALAQKSGPDGDQAGRLPAEGSCDAPVVPGRRRGTTGANAELGPGQAERARVPLSAEGP